jgi:peptide deformylase
MNIMDRIRAERKEVLVYPSPILTTKCDICTRDPEGILTALETALLGETGEYIGVGLAANQIGIAERVCIIRYGGTSIDLINPEFVKVYNPRFGSQEGCLSIPGLYTVVMRYSKVLIKADNYDRPLMVEDRRLAATIQHEMDHLDGCVLLDHVKISPNAPCYCGSTKKYKRCCGKND